MQGCESSAAVIAIAARQSRDGYVASLLAMSKFKTRRTGSLAAEVFGHRRHLQRRHLAGNGVHHRVVVGALALVELLELGFGVRRKLPGQAGQAGSAFGLGAVAAGAGGKTAELVALW